MMMMMNNDMVMQFGSFIATIVFLKALYEQYLPYHWREAINSFLWKNLTKIMHFFSNYHNIIFEEYAGERFGRSEAYIAIETYLSEKASSKARRLKGSFVEDGKSLMLGLNYNEEVVDEFQGVRVWWTSCVYSPNTQTITFYPGNDELRHYKLVYHSRDKKFVTGTYLNHILEEGKSIAISKRQRKLFTNVKEEGSYYCRGRLWSHVEFKHPANFGTLGMKESKKQAIVDDLQRFSKAKTYYNKIGKPWKRGYLLYGPPGTGKSTMIAAMANLLEYDVYDLELTAVKDNTQLRKLLIQTGSKSIIVIEDIDCSLDLTGKRSSKEKEKEGEGKKEVKDVVKEKLKGDDEEKKSQVTLSGLLNFIDGIWSACGEERLIVFTTNHIDKLDQALIRRGRMDMHIELSYCCYEAFLVLAKNYLDIDEHPLFEKIKVLLSETNACPADVAENLMPKSLHLDDESHETMIESGLKELISALEKAKDENKLKAAAEEVKKKELISALEKAKEDNKLKAAAEEEKKREKSEVKEENEGNHEVVGDDKEQKEGENKVSTVKENQD